MKLSIDPRLPDIKDVKIRPLMQRLYELFRNISGAINDSLMWATSGTTAPVSGSYAVGDKCKNTSPSELGTAGSKYVILGWVCVTSGTPGTWKQMRVLTGN